MYISHQGLKAMQEHRVEQCLQRAELKRKMPLEECQAGPVASPERGGAFSLRVLTSAFRRAVARV